MATEELSPRRALLFKFARDGHAVFLPLLVTLVCNYYLAAAAVVSLGDLVPQTFVMRVLSLELTGRVTFLVFFDSGALEFLKIEHLVLSEDLRLRLVVQGVLFLNLTQIQSELHQLLGSGTGLPSLEPEAANWVFALHHVTLVLG